MPMLDVLNSESDYKASNGVDCRNYGELTGISDAKKLFSEYMGVSQEEIIIVGSSSLAFMYDCLARAMLRGVLESEKSWGHYPKVKFLCPSPGYDRHFFICEFLGIEMISVPMGSDGPNMDIVERLVAEDETVKGIWCVPKFSNPLGITYSEETIQRLASMSVKAKDFRIFCDNAYAMHYVYRDVPLINILEACKKAGNPNRVYLFGSLSKVTFPGASVAFFAASKENIKFVEEQIAVQTISWDKLNMLRHVRFFKDMDGIREHMKKHAEILRPRFDIVLDHLERELVTLGVGNYIRPEGGYFVTYVAPAGCARRIVSLCKEAGLILTNAGATHPYGKDPDDSYIRIAPSFPSCEDLNKAMKLFCVAARIAFLEKYK
ncbi:MAG: aminotransferase class I/II-fold pyridoxal phosphate-dependent enzyme [Clostridiales bacterium]|nr:aminotransferase class I/II-fold pyridoxal phosphate-dependent enzyme [Clostridiales bacterium]